MAGKFEEVLTKKIANLPVWAWGLVGIAGIGVGYLIIRKTSTPAIPTGTQASDTSSGNVQADNSGMGLYPSGNDGSGGGYQPTPPPPPAPPPPAPPPPGGNPNPPGSLGNPLIQSGQWGSTPIRFGETKVVNGVTYTIGPGGGNRVWGVEGTGWNLQDWNRVPIGTGPGQKVLLYQG